MLKEDEELGTRGETFVMNFSERGGDPHEHDNRFFTSLGFYMEPIELQVVVLFNDIPGKELDKLYKLAATRDLLLSVFYAVVPILTKYKQQSMVGLTHAEAVVLNMG